MMPARKAILYVVDTSGKTHPVKATLLPDGTVLLPISIEKDAIGLATETTLSAIKAQTDKLIFDEVGRLYIQNPPNLDTTLSSVRDNMNIGRIGGVMQTGEDWTPHIKNIDNIATERTLGYMATEGGMRCFEVTVDDTFAVPTGQTWYVKNLYITTGALYLDGEVKCVG